MTERRAGSGHRFPAGGAALLAALLLVLLNAAAQIPANTERGRALSKRMMCLCGCNQILGECNHVGCSMSTKMLRQLDDLVNRGDSDDLIIQAMIQEYGPRVMAQPAAEGFTLLAWVMPVVMLLGGAVIVHRVILRWRRQPAPAAAGPPADPELMARASAEAEREEL